MAAPCVIDAGTSHDALLVDRTEWTKDSMLGTLASYYTTDGETRVRAQLLQATTITTGYLQRTISLDISALATKALSLDLAVEWMTMRNTLSSALQLVVEFSSETDFSKSMVYTSPTIMRGQQRLLIGPSEWTNNNGESWSNTMVRMRFGLKPTFYGLMPQVAFLGMASGVVTAPAALFWFGNWYHSIMDNAVPFLTGLGVRASRDISIEDIGIENKPTLDDHHELDALGWTAIGHLSAGYSGVGIPHATGLDACDRDVLRLCLHYAVGWYASHGISRPRFWTVAPVRMTPFIQMEMERAGIALCDRSYSASPLQVGVSTPLTRDMALGVAQTPLTVNSGITLQQAKDYHDACRAAGRSIIYALESLAVSPSGQQWGWQNFQDLVAYIEAEGTPIMSLDEWAPFAGVMTGISLNDRSFTLGAPPATHDLSVTAGEDIDARFTVGNDISGCSVSWRLAATSGASLIEYTTAGGGIELSDPASGVLTVSIDGTDTAPLAPGWYRSQLRVLDSEGKESVVAHGRVYIRGAIT